MTALIAAAVSVGLLVIGMVLGVFGLVGTILAAFATVIGSVIMVFLPRLQPVLERYTAEL